MIYFEAERAKSSGGIYYQKDERLNFAQYLHNSFKPIKGLLFLEYMCEKLLWWGEVLFH